MTKPWQEEWKQTEWASVGDAKGQPHEWLLGVVRTGENAAHAHRDPELVARARLASAAPDLVRALLAVEVDINYDEATCASCQAPAAYDHATSVYSIPKHEPDCALDAALRKAGAR